MTTNNTWQIYPQQTSISEKISQLLNCIPIIGQLLLNRNIKNIKEASQLVTDGFFKITRNPMYLGMLLFLLGLSIYNGLIVGLVFLPLFVGYITFFQIIPEESAMIEIFGEDYKAYMKKVRRWI